MTNKLKIINDPVYGLITIPTALLFDIISHPIFQRLRRIKQMGLSEYVYPGALHTRFHHAIGAMHLMGLALETLQSKGISISEKEKEAALIAILLHDVGHGPFSHVLEFTLFDGIHHEEISLKLMEVLNQHFDNQLELAIEMFKGNYERPFFHQLISSQLDIDRLDYLKRDSYYTGVAEGTVGVDRIIKMLHVIDNQIVVEYKGLLSIENFLNARRLMYWQVYLHKTGIVTEIMLKKIITRARDLIQAGKDVWHTQSLKIFLQKRINQKAFSENSVVIDTFVLLDDFDFWACIKEWQFHEDKTLSFLCKSLLNRSIFKIKLSNNAISEEEIEATKRMLEKAGIEKEALTYFIEVGEVSNKGYIEEKSSIKIVMKNNEIKDISEASDLPTIKALSNIVKKYYLSWVNPLYL
jgi:uncharacterized protein